MKTFCQRESAPSKTTTVYCKIMVFWLATQGAWGTTKQFQKNAKCLLRTSCSSTPCQLLWHTITNSWMLNKWTCKHRFHWRSFKRKSADFWVSKHFKTLKCIDSREVSLYKSMTVLEEGFYSFEHHKYWSWIQAIGRVLVHTPSNSAHHCSGRQRQANHTNDGYKL